MFLFNPKTDEEIHAIQNQGLMADGIYSFRVKAVTTSQSKSGNNMLEVVLGVMDNDSNERNIRDYLVATDKMIFKTKHFCEAIGFEKEYASGKFDPMKCIDRSGKLVIATQKGGAKDDGSGYYPDKNIVRDYVKSEPIAANDFLNDDIKF
jgi:hypothetical protein